MRRLLPILLVLALACGLLPPGRAPTRPGATPAATTTLAPLPSASQTAPPATAAPAITATPAPHATLQPTSVAPAAYVLSAADVIFEPDPRLYSGDVASVVVVGRGAGLSWQGAHAKLFVDGLRAAPRAQAEFAQYGLGGRWQATFTWVWDTRGRVGPQTVYVEIDPPTVSGARAISQTLAVPVTILPDAERPAPERAAQWVSVESACCIFNYLSHTAAARDIDLIRSTADAAMAHDQAALGVALKGKITFTMLSRLLGNGGFTAGEVSITYIDRNAAASDLFTIFAHEETHVLDRQLARTRPTIMTEGLAVFVAGGHFHPEPLEARAAALTALDGYIPLAQLANHFYQSQHEVGYLEAGSFIQYLVDQYGWPRFRMMYGAFNPAPSDAQMLDAALQVQYGQGLGQLEAAWLAYLRALPPDPRQVDNLRLTIRLYDTLRRYQQLYDPSAYFLTAWLPDGTEARARGLFADFIRHPDGPDNIALESMLVAAGQALKSGDYAGAANLVDGVNAALDAGSLDAHPLAAEELAVVRQVLAAGYEPQHITLDHDAATVQAVSGAFWPRLDELTLRRGGGGWQVLASGWLDVWLRAAQ